MHTLVIHRELFETYPWISDNLYAAFDDSKQKAMERLETCEPLPASLPWLYDDLLTTKAIMGDDYWPYGIEPNREVLETICRYLFDQGLCVKQVAVDDLFV